MITGLHNGEDTNHKRLDKNRYREAGCHEYVHGTTWLKPNNQFQVSVTEFVLQRAIRRCVQ